MGLKKYEAWSGMPIKQYGQLGVPGVTALSNGYNYVLIFVYLSTDYCCEALFTNLNVTVDNLHQF